MVNTASQCRFRDYECYYKKGHLAAVVLRRKKSDAVSSKDQAQANVIGDEESKDYSLFKVTGST